MGLLGKVFGGSVGTAVEQIGNTVDKFITTPEEKQKFKIDVMQILQQREQQQMETLRTELQSKERIIVAELQQGDNYTKRARPSVIYAGLVFIFFNYCLVPFIGWLHGNTDKSAALELPAEFWWAWGSVVGVYAIGRSYEKAAGSTRVTRAVTGSQDVSFFDEEDTQSPVG